MLLPRLRSADWRRLARYLVCAAAMGLWATPTASAQDQAPAGYKAYTLEFADPAKVGDELQKALAQDPSQPDVLIDRQLRRILVRGDDAAQQAAAELVKMLDQRPRRPAAGAADEPVMRAYRAPKEHLHALATELRQTFARPHGVRVTVDERLGRLLVKAPPAIHEPILAKVSARGGALDSDDVLAERPAGVARTASFPVTGASGQGASGQGAPGQGAPGQGAQVAGAGGAASVVAGPSERRSYILRNITWRELENKLQEVWGASLRAQVHNNGELAVLQAATASGQPVTLEIDRRRDQVTIAGPAAGARSWERIIQVLDSPYGPEANKAHFVRYQHADPRAVQRAVMLLDRARREAGSGDGAAAGGSARRRRTDPISVVFQPAPEEQAAPAGGGTAPAAPVQAANFQPPGGQPFGQEDGQFGPDGQPLDEQMQDEDQPADEPPAGAAGGFLGAVQIEFVEELGIVIVRGNAADVARVMQVIEEIEGIVDTTTPSVEIYHLRYANSTAVATMVTTLYDQVLSARQGQVSITALGKPNALLLIGRDDSVQAIIGLIAKLDQPMPTNSEFRVFQLRAMSAIDAETRLNAVFTEPTALEPRVRVVGDYRSNALIVSASPRDMLEVERVLAGIDVAASPAVDEVRIFKLRNAVAADLAPVLQDAINGQLLGAGRGQSAQAGIGQQQQLQAGQAQQAQIRSHALMFALLDSQGGKLLRSGIVYDVRVTADEAGNALIVTAPPDCMDLIAAVIEQLDKLPNAQASIKVFTIVNGDAAALSDMLGQLFGVGQAGAAAGGLQALLGAAAGAGESALVPLNFAVDTRTNSIIAAGAESDLLVVESILLRLDESDIRQRRVEVYRLRNSPAPDVANSINQYLTTERQIAQLVPDQVSGVEQIEREVVVVAEPVSNSLIVAATPRYFDQVRRIVEDLDRRPPMVMIQAVIAEVNLNRFVEFGVEWGLQDSLLFDRSTTTDAGTGAAALDPGFNFNNRPLGNSASAASQATRDLLGGQSLSHFALGRTNPTLGYGGLVLSAASDSVNILLRALQTNGRAQVLSRPQIMTLDNQPAFVQVGARVPYITQSQVLTTGTVNTVELQNVGIILGVTPRVSPDGLIVMQVDVEKSELGPDATGVPISINQEGDVIRAPQILISTAQTTVSARSGQTIILGGLITKSRSETSRRIPYLGDIPVLGSLFRVDTDDGERTELLVILTPIVMFGDQEVDWLKVVESDRMSWVLGDLVELHGEVGLAPGRAAWGRPRAAVIFPADDPTASQYFNNLPENGAEEVDPGDPNEQYQFDIPPPQQAPMPQQAPPQEAPPFEQQSSRRGAGPPSAPSASLGALDSPYLGPPPQPPSDRPAWYAGQGGYPPPAPNPGASAVPVSFSQ